MGASVAPTDVPKAALIARKRPPGPCGGDHGARCVSVVPGGRKASHDSDRVANLHHLGRSSRVRWTDLVSKRTAAAILVLERSRFSRESTSFEKVCSDPTKTPAPRDMDSRCFGLSYAAAQANHSVAGLPSESTKGRPSGSVTPGSVADGSMPSAQKMVAARSDG